MKYILQHQQRWAAEYDAIAAFLGGALPAYCRLHHVGSTAVPGMPAKDIIDLDIELPPGCMPEVIRQLAEAGYQHEGDRGIPTREAFMPLADSRAAALPPHHLYACESSAPELQRHLAFRDYLRAHPRRAAWLAEQKRNADKLAPSRAAYIEAKSPAYQTIVAEAHAWRRQPPRNPEVHTDAND